MVMSIKKPRQAVGMKIRSLIQEASQHLNLAQVGAAAAAAAATGECVELPGDCWHGRLDSRGAWAGTVGLQARWSGAAKGAAAGQGSQQTDPCRALVHTRCRPKPWRPRLRGAGTSRASAREFGTRPLPRCGQAACWAVQHLEHHARQALPSAVLSCSVGQQAQHIAGGRVSAAAGYRGTTPHPVALLATSAAGCVHDVYRLRDDLAGKWRSSTHQGGTLRCGHRGAACGALQAPASLPHPLASHPLPLPPSVPSRRCCCRWGCGRRGAGSGAPCSSSSLSRCCCWRWILWPHRCALGFGVAAHIACGAGEGASPHTSTPAAMS